MKNLVAVSIIIVAIAAFCIVSCRFVDHEQPQVVDLKQTEYACALVLLENTADGMMIHSLKSGYGGNKNFPNSLDDIRNLVMSDAANAFPGPQQKPYEGFILKLEEFVAGDDFKTNFKIIAEPAPGYTGAKYMIDKSKKVTEFK